MRFFRLILSAAAASAASLAARSSSSAAAAVEALVQRRLPQQSGSFVFSLAGGNNTVGQGHRVSDTYTVSSTDEGKIYVEGNSVGGLLSG
jgi:hypothetical protein